MGLGSLELEKHVQFHHPKTLEQAINFAMEYTSVCGNLDKTLKPPLDNTSCLETDKLSAVTSLTPLPMQTSFTQQDLERIINQVIDKRFAEQEQNKRGDNSNDVQLRGRSPVRRNRTPFKRENTPPRKGTPVKGNIIPVQNKTVRFNDRDNSENRAIRPREIQCAYCNRNNHVESRCYIKLRVLDMQQQQQQKQLQHCNHLNY